MSRKNVTNIHTTESKVIKPIEIVILVLAFLAVLFLLYPKGKLEQHILQEKSNYDLTAIYLQNLIRLQPDNSQLVLSMANTLYQQEKYHLAINLLDVLKQDTNQEVHQQAALTHLNINKARADKEKDPEKKRAFLAGNKKLLQSISHERLKDLNSSKTLYYAALSIGDKESALNFNANILPLVEGKEQLTWFKNLHYLADELNNTRYDKVVLTSLIKADKPHSQTWLTALQPLLDKDDDIDILAQDLKLKGKTLANFYLLNKRLDKAASIYQSLYHDEKNPVVKTTLLNKMISIFRMNAQSAKAADIVRAYEDDYLDSPNMMKKFLKLYLEANHADYAKNLSLKIIKHKDIK